MKKGKNSFVCQECGYKSIKWLGQCNSCGEWNSMVSTGDLAGPVNQPKSIDEITGAREERLPSSIGELDRVLGGGLVPGSLILVGGDPGIGKSTLLLQVAGGLTANGPVLYVSGEESLGQLKLRAQRLGVSGNDLKVLAMTDLGALEQILQDLEPGMLIIDSIQTMSFPHVDSMPGSVTQIRELGSYFLRYSKENDVPVFLVGHVTKDGSLAGPKILEHLVDCVLYFEGDQHYSFRILRSIKNRFGSINEVGVFRMENAGLLEVPNPSSIFIEERPKQAPGSAIFPSMEGSRPIMVEVQALLSPTSFGQPQRMTAGVDHRRVSMLMAVLEKRAGLEIGWQDVYVNVAGGIRLNEPAADLAMLAAMASSFLERPVPDDVILCGEIGLTGELRGVPRLGERLREAEKMGLRRALLPEKARVQTGMEVVPLASVQELIQYLFANNK